MKKITEINIIGEGKQLKKIIEDNYTYSELVKKFKIDRSSILRYVGGIKIDNNKFIKNIEDLFQKSLNHIITPVEEQLKYYLLEIKNNIKHYNTSGDNKIIKELYDYAMAYCQPYYQLIAKGNFALYKYNMGLHYDTEIMLEEIVDRSLKEDFKELVIYYTVQLAFVHIGYDLKKSRKTLFRAELMLEYTDIKGQISKDTLFSYYHFYGVVLQRSKKYEDARGAFEKAIEVATNDSKMARALSNVGITYHLEKKYNNALLWSRRALDKCSADIEIRSSILNNMANMYYKKGDVAMAHSYLTMAMEGFAKKFYSGRKMIVYDTYLTFYATEGTKLLEVILEVFESCTVINEFQEYLVSCVEKLFQQLQKNKDYQNIKKLMFSLIKYCKVEGEKRYLGEFKILIVDIMHYLTDEGVFDLEKSLQGSTGCNDCKSI